MRCILGITITLAILYGLASAVHFTLTHWSLWAVPLWLAAVFGFGYAVAFPDERREFQSTARLLLRWPGRGNPSP